MIPITPISAETLSPYVGKPVYAVTHDGTRHYGIIRGIEGNQLFLDGGGNDLSLASIRSKMGKDWKPTQAQTKAFFPGRGFGFGYGAFALSLAALAAIWFIPWLFFW